MGANISRRPGKCLKNRRTKSEEYLEVRRSSKNGMGRFSTPWHDIVSGNIVNGNQDRPDVNRGGIFEGADWPTNKDFSSGMEKSYTEIHRSNSLDKSGFENSNHIVVMDCTCHSVNLDELSPSKRRDRRLRIDVEKGECAFFASLDS